MKTLRSAFFVAALTALAPPAAAQKVTIDYAHDFDFDSIHTFQYVATEDSDVTGNQIMANRIVSMITKELQEGGLRQVDENPDLYVTYHFVGQERKGYSTTSMGYGGYWGGWGGWGGYDPWGGPMMGTSTTREYSYEEGTLVIDAYDSTEKKLVWRGEGTVTLKASPEKRSQQIDTIVTKMGQKWEKILAKQGK